MEITPGELAQALRSNAGGVALIDCREPEEHAAARIGGATLIPMGETASRMSEIEDVADEAEHVVVYCHHGVRSLRVVSLLRAAGIDDAVSLAGGIDRWSLEIDPGVPRY
jgi:rhodanese-related sulfurtransferase